MPTVVTSLRTQLAGVDEAGRPRDPDVDDALARLDEIDCQGRHGRRVGGVDDGIEAVVGELVDSGDALETEAAGEVDRRVGSTGEVHLDSLGAEELGGQQTDRAWSDDKGAIAGLEPRSPCRPQGVAAWLDHRSGDGVDSIGQRVERRGGDRQLLGKRAWEAAADADLVPLRAQVLPSVTTAIAVAAAEHRVSGDRAPDPAAVHAVADRRHGPAPLMAWAQRV